MYHILHASENKTRWVFKPPSIMSIDGKENKRSGQTTEPGNGKGQTRETDTDHRHREKKRGGGEVVAGVRCGIGGEESEKVTVSMTSRACSFRFWHTIAYVMM